MKRRRQEYKTDYHARLRLLKSGKPRIVFRKTNRYVIGQYVQSKAAQDAVAMQANSCELLKLGWPKASAGSLKSLPACYLTGLLLGKRIKERYGQQESILDLGILRNAAGSRIYAFVQGVKEGGVLIKVDETFFPKKEKIQGSHIKKDLAPLLDKIAKNIEHE